MDILEKLRQWLGEAEIFPRIDSCQLAPGETGLFPLGQEQLSFREDVLGNVTRRVRYSFSLQRTAAPGFDAARWLLLLQELAAKNPPRLSDDQRFRAEKGKLLKHTSTGLGIYEVRLIAEMEETV